METVIGKPSRSHVDDALKIEGKTQTESGDRPEEKRLTSAPTELITIFLNVDFWLESI